MIFKRSENFWVFLLACGIFCLVADNAIADDNLEETYSPYDSVTDWTARNRDAIVTAALDEYEGHLKHPSRNTKVKVTNIIENKEKAAPKVTGKVKGEVRLRAGVDPEGIYWNKSNFDLNEKNWRILSNDALNQRMDSYDTGIYQRLRLDVDIKSLELPVSMHSKISIDPWSFIYKSDPLTLQTGWGTTSDVQVFGWANSGYTIGQSFSTKTGDLFNIPEIKIRNGKIQGAAFGTAWGDTVTLPETDMDLIFNPLRELWFDIKLNDSFKMRIFPHALEDQALISDDPLHLSGHKIYWENSPWTNSWKSGGLHSNATESYTKGEWDDSLAFFTRDSDGTRLTALRGISFDMSPSENTNIKATVASPKTLWQDYDDFDTLPASVRVKHFITDDLYLGSVSGMQLGYDEKHNLDAYNYTTGLDFGKSINDKTKLEGQISFSNSHYDITNDTYDSRKHGNAYYLSLTNSSAEKDNLINKDYYKLRPTVKDTNSFRLTKLYSSFMDEDFESTLSKYHNTRNDSFWSRHIHFRKPFTNFFAGSDEPISLYDLEPFAIGDGIDYGRYVFGLRNEMGYKDKLRTLFDIHSAFNSQNDKNIETVIRTESELKATEKLRLKVLSVNNFLPKTKDGIDPYLYNSDTGAYLENPAIVSGKDPSTRTASVGGEYDITDKIKGHLIWEYTNDLVANGSGNFPRGLFLATWSGDDYVNNGNTYMITHNSLYNQGVFGLPPYDYHNIFRVGLEITPNEKWDIYLDYTRNPNKFAGPIDGNMNHAGIETTYMPNDKLGFLFKYTWSKWYDIGGLINNELDYSSHHNFSAEAKYLIDKQSSLMLAYGVGPSQELSTPTFDPFGNAIATIDTQHILRIFYTRKF